MNKVTKFLDTHVSLKILAQVGVILGIITFIWQFFLSDPYYSAAGQILDADGKSIPLVKFQYSLDGKNYRIDSANKNGYYKIAVKGDKIILADFECYHGEDSIITSLPLTRDDGIQRHIILKRRMQAKIVVSKPPDPTKRPVEKATETVSKAAARVDTQVTVSVKSDKPLPTHPPLPEYEIIQDPDGALIPYFPENTTLNDQVSRAGSLYYTTPIHTEIVPSAQNNQCILFSFYDDRKKQQTKGWIRLKDVRLKSP